MSLESILANKRARPKKLFVSTSRTMAMPTRHKSTKASAGKPKAKTAPTAQPTVVKPADAKPRSAKPTPPPPSSSSASASSRMLNLAKDLERDKAKMESVRSASASAQSKPPPAQASHIPFKALNQAITSQLTTRAGARPTAGGQQKPLPSNYKSVARRVTMTIVALPIAIVTSWVLWDRR
ncbi:hypothetical protein CJF31_00002572 [Rutstroemia sp. NJR-2017a BVV2]|nr:hypothetical protein CJF31_00002572 [Rutstroemia sp. NJR-2017a BVV2]